MYLLDQKVHRLLVLMYFLSGYHPWASAIEAYAYFCWPRTWVGALSLLSISSEGPDLFLGANFFHHVCFSPWTGSLPIFDLFVMAHSQDFVAVSDFSLKKGHASFSLLPLAKIPLPQNVVFPHPQSLVALS